MNKQELVNEISTRSGLNKTQSELALNAFCATVTDTLRDRGEVVLVGFGRFHSVDRAATTGRNPQTGEPIEIPARKVARFSPGEKLKAAVND